MSCGSSERDSMDRTGGAPRVLIIDDDPFKKIGIQKALEFCGVREIVKAKNQQMGFDIIYAGQRDEKPVELIVTDMNYPLDSGMPEDPDAGFRLIERLRRENLEIPVIICSSLNYNVPEILGCVWYNELCDMNGEFRKILERFRKA